jgi:dTDP-4-dehydrorhamnose reductase
LIELGRGELNLANPAAFERTLAEISFDTLINCAACTGVDDCEIQGELAYLVNGQAPGTLARICSRRGARMIQFSTDYVFDGQSDRPYTEEDPPNPVNVYGKSKLLGEQLVREASDTHLVVRLSWLFGMGRAAFPDWLLKRAANQPRVEVVSDKIACPTYNRDAVAALRPWLADPALPGGILHFCNPPGTAWNAYAQFILDCAAEHNLPLQTRTVDPISISALPGLVARRPAQSALCTDKFARLTGAPPRPWREAVREYVAQRQAAGNS